MTKEKKWSLPLLNLKWMGEATNKLATFTIDQYRNLAMRTKTNKDDALVAWVANQNPIVRNPVAIIGTLGVGAGVIWSGAKLFEAVRGGNVFGGIRGAFSGIGNKLSRLLPWRN